MSEPASRALEYTYKPRSAFIKMHDRDQRWGVVICHRRAGKRLIITTEVPMADGSWKTMGTLVDGDVILSPDGWPTTVTKVHPIELAPESYRVCFDDGSSVLADAEHLWVTQTKLDRAHKNQQRRRGHPNPQQRPATPKTTREIADSLMYQGESNHTIQLTAPVLLPPAELPIPPYIMGLWLGDGTSLRFELTNMDDEPLAAWRTYAAEMGFECVEMDDPSRSSRLQLRQGSACAHPNTILRAMGLGKSGVKFIPEIYLSASVEQRIDLLKGLMDSDGSIDSQSRMEITFKHREMIDGVHQLLCSLGVKVARPNEKRVQLAGWDEPRLYWRLNFTTGFCPFNIQRHIDRWQPRHATHNESGKRFIVAVEAIDPVPMRCITVDSPDHQYLVTRDYIPTHNTISLLNELIVRAMSRREDGLRQQFAYMCPFQNQARSVGWIALKEYTEFLSKAPGYKISEMNLTITLPDPADISRPGSTISLLGAENAEKLRGLFLDGVVLDEFQDIPAYVWDTILRPALADRGGFAVFSGTVKGHDNGLWEFYQKALKDPQRWFSMLVKASESGILPQAELDDLKLSMTDEAYAAEMECDPNATVTGRILLQYINQQQVTRVPWQPDGGPVIAAWDLGMSDTTDIWTAQVVGKEVHLLDFCEENGQSLSYYVDWLRKLPYARHIGTHLMPHDTNVRELGTGVSRKETLRNMGVRGIKIVPKLPKAQQIDAGRMLMARCWFDAEGCAKGLPSLRGYQYAYDKVRQCFSVSPEHSKHSNGADAFLQLAVGLKKAMNNDSSSFGMNGVDDELFFDSEVVAEPWQGDVGVF